MDDKNFDKFISDALKDFSADYDPSNWSQFENRMESGNDLKANEFDHLIKERLTNYSVPLDPNHWKLFDEQLNRSLYDNYASELDVAVRQNLGNLSVPYDEKTWPILEKKIKERKAYVRKLIITKSIEAAIVIFAIFTFYTYFPLYQQQFQNWKSDKNQFVEHQNIEILDRDSNDELANAENNSIKENRKENNDVKLYKEQIIPPENSIILSSRFQESNNPELNLEPNIAVKADNVFALSQENSGLQNRSDILSATQLVNELPLIVQKIKQYNAAPFELDNLKRIGNLAIASRETRGEESNTNISLKLNRKVIKELSSSSVALASINQQSPTFNDFEQKKKKKIWRLGIHGSADINYVNIPQDEYVDYDKKLSIFNEKDLAEFGAGAGLSLNVKLGAVSLETGVHYSNKSYDPNKNYSPAQGYSQINYKKINMDIVEIPLNVHYYWQNDRRLKYYAVAGVAVNAIAISDHDLIIPKPTFLGQPRTSEENFEVLRVKSHFLQSDADRKVFFTANLGIGVEYQINEQYSIYAEPVYKQQFLSKGIGPNQDKINSSSLKIGSRMTF